MWHLQLHKIAAKRRIMHLQKKVSYLQSKLGNTRFLKQAWERSANGEPQSNEIKEERVLEAGDTAATESS